MSELQSLIIRLEDGARLPTIRELMRRFSVSQSTVQEALRELRDAGQLTSLVGRGTFVTKAPDSAVQTSVRGRNSDAPDQRLGSFLILSSSRMNERIVRVQNGIQTALSAENIDVVQMSYQDIDQLLLILRNMPRFDAAILQSYFDNLPIRLLNLLQERSNVIVADGHSISGVDIDRVGTDWTEAIDSAIEYLTDIGHRRVGLVTIDGIGRPILTARRYFSRLANWRGTGLEVHPPLTLSNMVYPTQQVSDRLVAVLRDVINDQGRLPFTAMLILGVSDGSGIKHALDDLKIKVPRDLSVHMLGHNDVPSEHFQTFSISGTRAKDAVSELVGCVKARLSDPHADPRMVYLPIHRDIRTSSAAPIT